MSLNCNTCHENICDSASKVSCFLNHLSAELPAILTELFMFFTQSPQVNSRIVLSHRLWPQPSISVSADHSRISSHLIQQCIHSETETYGFQAKIWIMYSVFLLHQPVSHRETEFGNHCHNSSWNLHQVIMAPLHPCNCYCCSWYCLT